MHLLSGVLAFLVVAFVANLALGQFKPGFDGQPIAHTDGLWNFLGMAASGLAFAPGRRLPRPPAHPGGRGATATPPCSCSACWWQRAWRTPWAGPAARPAWAPTAMAATFAALGFCLFVGVVNLKKA